MVDEFVTDYPKNSKFIDRIIDPITELSMTWLLFENAGDYQVTRGPKNLDFFERGPTTSFNTCDKKWSVVYTFNGIRTIETFDEFYNSDYSLKKHLGPFYIIAEEDNTNYFCVQVTENPFNPIETIQFEYSLGDTIELEDYVGWNLLIMNGQIQNNKKGSFLRIETGNPVTASEDNTKICLVKIKE